MTSAPIRFTARAPRSRFGRVALWTFWLFQLLMLLLSLGNCSLVLPYVGSEDPEVAAGALSFGTMLGAGVLTIWPVGTVVLGLLAILTRGRKLILEQLAPPAVPPSGA